MVENPLLYGIFRLTSDIDYYIIIKEFFIIFRQLNEVF